MYRFTAAHNCPEGPGHIPPRVGIVEPVLPENDQGGRGAQAGHHLGDALPVVVNLPPFPVARFAHGAAGDPLPGNRLGMGAVFQVAQPRNAGLLQREGGAAEGDGPGLPLGNVVRRGHRLAAGLPPAQDEIGLLGVKVGGQGVGVSGHLAGQELRFPFRQNLHGARPAVGGVPDVVAAGLLGVSGL